MKKLNFIACMMAVVAIAISTSACNKEIARPSGNVNNAVASATQLVNTSAITKKPLGYIGQSTLGDSTKTTTQP